MKQNTVVRAAPQGWQGVEPAGYAPEAPGTGVARHTIVGTRKNDASEPGPRMELRYFEVEPGSASRLEKHEHEHYVVVRTGRGYAIVGDQAFEVAADDIVYVAPFELHQFVNRGNGPFGFYCFVESVRDIPQVPNDDEIERLLNTPAGAVAKPHAVPPPVKR
jgi:mannose-6-phosphate isomerase-like protein (cupin superfamily)